MKKTMCWSILLLWATVLAVDITAQPYPDLQQAQDRAMASRAARLDAIRQLAETIRGIKISSTTTVRDFLIQKEEINSTLTVFLEGARQCGEPVYHLDGTCEVTMMISLDQIITWLQQTYHQYHSKVIISPQELETIRRYYPASKMFMATGTAAMKRTSDRTYEDVWQYVTPQGRLMALRAAQIDAYRNIGETIKGVRLSSTTSVKDFVTTNDEIFDAFNGVVRAVEFVGEPRYKPEGIVEVTAQIDIDKLISSLATVCNTHYCGSRWNSQIFTNMRHYCHTPVIQATGVGVPPSHCIRMHRANNFPIPTRLPVPEWSHRMIRVTGRRAYTNNSSQAKSIAKRAAEMDAYRLLTEQIMSLKLDNATTVHDFVSGNDEIKCKINTFIRDARIIDTRDSAQGNLEIDMEIYLGDLWQMIEQYYRRRR